MKKQLGTNKPITETEIWIYALQIILGIDYLHKENIIHRDVKCLNVLIQDRNFLKISDLGVSKFYKKDEDKQKMMKESKKGRVGTPLYLSPEIIQSQVYDYKIDVWAIGCSLY